MTSQTRQRTSVTSIWHITMSLDGYIAGPDDTMDWAFGAGPAGPLAAEIRDATGAILAGRRWHDVAIDRYNGRAGIYGGDWNGPVFVLTHRPPVDLTDTGIQFLSGSIQDAMSEASEAAGGRMVGIFGADVARQTLGAGLLDEIAVHIVPVLLGGGVRLYGDDTPRITLKRIAATISPGVVDLRFRVIPEERHDRAG